MDFTYPLAAISGAIVGLFTSCLFLLRGRGSTLRLITITFVASLALNGAGLINWFHIREFSPSFLFLDFFLIAAFTFVGSVIGASPALLFGALLQWRRRAARE